ncbi:MAG: hypothetical protein EOM12_15660 [Verrucomicrobiae bacterium]|nr:hypothetical protein [Verrucomicrobiae bacterium]
MQTYHNVKGNVYACLEENGVFQKNEHEKDRLRITGGKCHAIDEDVLNEAIQAGGNILQITEKTASGERRVFQIPLTDIPKHGKRVTLAGISRWTVPLAACQLLSGPEEEWRLIDRAELLRAEIRNNQVQEIRHEQGLLFSDEEKVFWRTRMRFEA